MVFEDGMAQKVDAFADKDEWIQHDLWVETSFDTDGDGELDRVHVDVTRPGPTADGLKVPVVYETSPYYSGVSSGDKKYFWDPEHELDEEIAPPQDPPSIQYQPHRTLISGTHRDYWIPRGFAVVHSCSPGTGRSQGCPTVGGENESLAPKAVIDWLCGRAKGFTAPHGGEAVVADWCNGKVGMTGTSYNGTLPLAAATTGVEGLEAIIPVAPNTSYYHYYRSHGLVRHPGGYMGEDIDILYNFINSGDPAFRDYCNEHVRDDLMRVNMDRDTGDMNAFWEGRDYLLQLDDVRCAVLMAHAFNDWNVMPNHGVRIYEALKQRGVPSRLFMHQGGHGGPPPMDMMNRWFSRYVCGIENGVEEEPRAWIVREGDRRTRPTPYAEYPHPDSELISVFPSGEGLAAGRLGAKQGKGELTLVDDYRHSGADLASAENSRHRLLFKTAPLAEPLHLSGTAEITVRLASTKPAVNLSVWIVSLPWTKRSKITDNIVTRGWADPQNRNGIYENEPLVPGEFVDVTFTLQPDDQILPKGAELALMIMSSDKDFTLWPEPGTEMTIDLAGTSLSLPVVGGAQALRKALE